MDKVLKWGSECSLKLTAEAEDDSSSDKDNAPANCIRVFDPSFAKKKDEEDRNVAAKIVISIITKIRRCFFLSTVKEGG